MMTGFHLLYTPRHFQNNIWFRIKQLQYFLEGGESSLHFLTKVQKEQIPRKLDRDPVILQPIIGNICLSEECFGLPTQTDQVSDTSCAPDRDWPLTHCVWCESTPQVVSP